MRIPVSRRLYLPLQIIVSPSSVADALNTVESSAQDCPPHVSSTAQHGARQLSPQRRPLTVLPERGTLPWVQD